MVRTTTGPTITIGQITIDLRTIGRRVRTITVQTITVRKRSLTTRVRDSRTIVRTTSETARDRKISLEMTERSHVLEIVLTRRLSKSART